MHSHGRSISLYRKLPRNGWLAAVTLLAFLLLGYHPFAEDGGIYTAAIEARLNPSLFPENLPWVTAHTRYALFVPLAAQSTRALHFSLPVMLFLGQAAGLLALLTAAVHLARTCFPELQPAWFAALVVAAAAGLPVAGTALYAVDPYCTARTVTTPLLLFALSFALRRRWTPCACCWIAAACLHPLMAMWGALPLVFTLALAARHALRWIAAIVTFTLLAALLLGSTFKPETADTRAVALTRAYWFPAQWKWYEWAGTIAPCFLLVVGKRISNSEKNSAYARLTAAALASTALATTLAICFARQEASCFAVARLQPLRSLHLIFLAFLSACGALVQSRMRTKTQTLCGIAGCLLIASSAFFMQRALYPGTPHLEWPGRAPGNGWERAFLWCRSNTPSDALFALDSRYIDVPGEDTHGFRAISQRSALPDKVKDAGVAAVLPALTPAWQAGVNATEGLAQLTDRERMIRLQPLRIDWIVLPAASVTAFTCPFETEKVKVCQLPR